jgi:hypothetical protein
MILRESFDENEFFISFKLEDADESCQLEYVLYVVVNVA